MSKEDGFNGWYFQYNPDNNHARININEYGYSKEEFDLNTELSEFIKEVDRLYNKCNDDRITYDSDANTEFYTREAIQDIPQTKLLQLKWRLESKYVNDIEKEKIRHQIEILTEVIKEIEELLE